MNFRNLIVGIITGLMTVSNLIAQTNPTPHNLANGAFQWLNFSSATTTYPTSMQGWKCVGTVGPTPPTGNTPASNAPLLANPSTTCTDDVIMNLGVEGIAVRPYWDVPSTTANSIGLALNTTNCADIRVEWTSRIECANLLSAGALTLQYRVGTSGNFTDLGVQKIARRAQDFSSENFTITLPAACNNRAVVQLRWLNYDASIYEEYHAIGINGININALTINSSAVKPKYCEATGTCTNTWIVGVNATGENSSAISQSSGCGGYLDQSAQSIDVFAGTAYNFTIAMSGTNPAYVLDVWVDWDDNGDFIDAGDLVGTFGAGVGNGDFAVVVPATATPGIKRLRMRSRSVDQNDAIPCGYSNWSEVEDYSLNVLNTGAAPPDCAVNPSPANNAPKTCSDVTLSWSAASTGATTDAYDVYFGTNNPPSIVSANQTTPSYFVSNLSPDSTYYWQVISRNSDGPATGCTVWSFTTSDTLDPFGAWSPNPADACAGNDFVISTTLTSPNRGGLTYNWSPGTNLSATNVQNPTFNGTAGNYTLSLDITDSRGCTDTTEYVINVAVSPTANAGSDGNACPGQEMTIGGSPAGSGGAGGPFTYSWSPSTGLSASNIANPVAGPSSTTTYTLTVTDKDGCTHEDEVVVTALPTPVADAGADQNVCAGNTATLGGSPSGSGGTGTLDYVWTPNIELSSNTTANPVASPTASRQYLLRVTDDNNCYSEDAVNINFVQNPVADAGLDKVNCPGNTPIIGGSPSGSGGTGPYTYSWSPGTGLSSNTAANPTATPASGTDYTLVVTDANNCTGSDEVRVDVSGPLTVNAGPDKAVCLGKSITIGQSPLTTDGDAPYQFSWSPSGSLSNNTIETPDASPSSTTTYTIIVTDDNGCSGQDQVTVTISSVFPTANAGPDATVCGASPVVLGGSPTAGSGTPPYSYSWVPSLPLDDPSASNPTQTNSSTTTYTVEVTDAAGCSASDQVKITVTPASVSPTIDGLQPAYCVSETGPELIVGTPQGGVFTGGGLTTGPLYDTFRYAGGFQNIPDNNVNGVSLNIPVTGLVGGNLGDGVKIHQVCLKIKHSYVGNLKAELENPNGSKVVLFDRPGHPTVIGGCPGDDIDVCIELGSGNALEGICTGGVPSITGTYTAHTGGDLSGVHDNTPANGGWKLNLYDLSGGDQGNIVSAEVILRQSTATFDPSAAGAGIHNICYNVTDGSCVGQACSVVEVYELPTVNAGNDTSICPGGTVMLGGNPTASGTVGPYDYTWQPIGDVSFNKIPNPTSNPVAPTTYTVEVVDGNGCKDSDEIEATVLVVDAGIDKEYCLGVGTQLGGNPTVRGGTLPYTVSWSPASLVDDATSLNPIALSTVDTTYTVTVTDGFGCVLSDEVFVQVNILPIAEAGNDTMLCLGVARRRGGQPTAKSGTGPYSYSWTPTQGVTGIATSNPVIEGTVSGYYQVEVVDQKGCRAVDSQYIEVLALPTANAGTDIVKCDVGDALIGGNPAGVGGKGPYTYVWEPAISLNKTNVSNPRTSTQVARTYSLTVIDQNKCEDKDVMEVSISDLAVNAGADKQVCQGGSVQIGGQPTALNGVKPYSYAWNPTVELSSSGVSNPVATPTATRSYVVLISDGLGCIARDTIKVTVVTGPTAFAGPNRTVCLGGKTRLGGSPTGQGGSGILTYQWNPTTGLSNPGIANPDLSGASSTKTYTVLVVDGNGCKSTDDVLVTVGPGLQVNAGADKRVCMGEQTRIGGSPAVSSGVAPYSYTWSPSTGLNNASASRPLANPTSTQTYVLLVRDVEGCIGRDTMSLRVDANPEADAGLGQTVCDGKEVTLGGSPSASGGAGVYTYTWSPGNTLTDSSASNPKALPQVPRNYVLTVADTNGCIDTSHVYVDISVNPTADAGLDRQLCAGLQTTIGGSPTGTGGVGPYVFTWSPAVGLSDASSSNPSLITDFTRTYTVEIVDSKNCRSEETVTVVVNPVVVAKAGQSQNICKGDTVILGGSPSAQGGVGPYSYYWSPGINMNNQSVSNPEAIPTQHRVYTLRVIDNNNCESIDTVSVKVYPRPVAQYTKSKVGKQYSFTDLSSNAGSWYWEFGDGSVSSQANPSHSYSGEGVYTVCLTVSNAGGCEDKFCEQIDVQRGVGVEEQERGQIRIYPNPTEGILMLESDLLIGEKVSYRLHDSRGRVIRKVETTGGEQVILDITSEAAGTYYLKVYHKDGVLSYPIMKLK